MSNSRAHRRRHGDRGRVCVTVDVPVIYQCWQCELPILGGSWLRLDLPGWDGPSPRVHVQCREAFQAFLEADDDGA